jgi:hypothetical protein
MMMPRTFVLSSLNIERDELFRLPLASRTSLQAIFVFIFHLALMFGGDSCPRPPILSRNTLYPECLTRLTTLLCLSSFFLKAQRDRR